MAAHPSYDRLANGLALANDLAPICNHRQQVGNGSAPQASDEPRQNRYELFTVLVTHTREVGPNPAHINSAIKAMGPIFTHRRGQN